MTITLPKEVEEKLAKLPQEEIEAALLRLAEQHGHDKEQALTDALQKGIDDLDAGKYTELDSDDELDAFFATGRKRSLDKLSQ